MTAVPSNPNVCRRCCERPPQCRSLCLRCDNWARRNGCLDAWAAPVAARKGPPCAVHGCERAARGKRGLCTPHDKILRPHRGGATPPPADAWYTEEKDTEPTPAELAEFERRKAEVLAKRRARL